MGEGVVCQKQKIMGEGVGAKVMRGGSPKSDQKWLGERGRPKLMGRSVKKWQGGGHLPKQKLKGGGGRTKSDQGRGVRPKVSGGGGLPKSDGGGWLFV